LFALGAVNYIPLWYREAGPNAPEEIVVAFVGFLRASLGVARPALKSSARKGKAK
jgi:hypothetical protein